MKRLLLVTTLAGLMPGFALAANSAGDVVIAPDTVTLIEEVVPEDATDLDLIEADRVACPLPVRFCKGRVEALSSPTTSTNSTTQVTVTYTDAGSITTQTWQKQVDVGSGEVSWRLLSSGVSVAADSQ